MVAHARHGAWLWLREWRLADPPGAQGYQIAPLCLRLALSALVIKVAYAKAQKAKCLALGACKAANGAQNGPVDRGLALV